jgi:hypothetical protein
MTISPFVHNSILFFAKVADLVRERREEKDIAGLGQDERN